MSQKYVKLLLEYVFKMQFIDITIKTVQEFPSEEDVFKYLFVVLPRRGKTLVLFLHLLDSKDVQWNGSEILLASSSLFKDKKNHFICCCSITFQHEKCQINTKSDIVIFI